MILILLPDLIRKTLAVLEIEQLISQYPDDQHEPEQAPGNQTFD
jgi:hypothetical protein